MTRFKTALALAALLACSCKNTTAPKSDTQVGKFEAPVEFNADSAYRFVADQVAFGPRVPGTDAHRACSRYIIDKLKAYGADSVIVQRAEATNYLGTVIPINNIMGRFNTDASTRVLLIAHWDTRPWADNDPNANNHRTPVDGANDGGSGTGVLLELARIMGTKLPDIGVDLLFVDGEDSGDSSGWSNNDDTWCLGTQQWVNEMPYSSDRLPKYGILLDMVGGKNARFYREYVSEQNARTLNDKVWSIADASGYSDRFPNSVHGGVIDDHVFINRAGIPTIDIIECSNPETGTFNRTWHTVDDTIDNIDKETLKAVGQTVANTIYLERNK